MRGSKGQTMTLDALLKVMEMIDHTHDEGLMMWLPTVIRS